MSDAHFALPRLAAVYDALDPDCSDLVHYARIVAELGAARVLDIGCGTGTFACMLGHQGVDVTALDPAAASLDVARGKPGAHRVRWVCGTVGDLPALQVDAVTMTGNVAQVFLTDDSWHEVLAAARRSLRPGGHLVFESRRPEDEAWRRWTPGRTRRRGQEVGGGEVTSWVEVFSVEGQLITFRTTFRFDADDTTVVSESTLRFRSADDFMSSLVRAGFAVCEVREAPDRPGCELVFVAQRIPEARDRPPPRPGQG